MSDTPVTSKTQPLPLHTDQPAPPEQPKAKRPGCTCDCGTCPCGPNAKRHDHSHQHADDKPADPPAADTDPAEV